MARPEEFESPASASGGRISLSNSNLFNWLAHLVSREIDKI